MEITLNDIPKLRRKIVSRAKLAQKSLSNLAGSGLSFLHEMRFIELGLHPIEGHALNIVEQINQTFTCLVSLRAAEFLLKRHKRKRLWLNLGNRGGTDIESFDGRIAAEAFAAVRPSNNGKLLSDMGKVLETSALHRYVFFYSPDVAQGRRDELERGDGIQVYSVNI
jgi:hypothetical protein